MFVAIFVWKFGRHEVDERELHPLKSLWLVVSSWLTHNTYTYKKIPIHIMVLAASSNILTSSQFCNCNSSLTASNSAEVWEELPRHFDCGHKPKAYGTDRIMYPMWDQWIANFISLQYLGVVGNKYNTLIYIYICSLMTCKPTYS